MSVDKFLPCTSIVHFLSLLSPTIYRGVLEIWKLMLTKVEEQGKRRLELSEMLTTNVSEMLRSLRKEKDQQFKTVCNTKNMYKIFLLSFSRVR